MDFECCSTLNRKRTEKKCNVVKNISAASSKKEDHPKSVNCSNIICNTYDLSFDKVNKIARVGNRYQYFCNEFCYLDWLKSPGHALWL